MHVVNQSLSALEITTSLSVAFLSDIPIVEKALLAIKCTNHVPVYLARCQVPCRMRFSEVQILPLTERCQRG